LFLFQSFPFKSTHFSLKKNFGEGFFNYVNYRFFSGKLFIWKKLLALWSSNLYQDNFKPIGISLFYFV
jgi:hypothetical protein